MKLPSDEIDLPDGVWDAAIAAKDAVRHVDHPDNYQAVYGMSRYAVRALIAAAYQAGRESACTRDEWRVMVPAPSGAAVWWSRSRSEEIGRADLGLAQREEPNAWLEHRRTGATEWTRVDV